MDDNRKTKPIFTEQAPSGRNRIILLVVAGGLLVGAAYYGFNEFKKREEPPAVIAGGELPQSNPTVTNKPPAATGPAANVAGNKVKPQAGPQAQPPQTTVAQTNPAQTAPGVKPPATALPTVPTRIPGKPTLVGGAVNGPQAVAPGVTPAVNPNLPQPALPSNTPVANLGQPKPNQPVNPNLAPGQPVGQPQGPNVAGAQPLPPAQPQPTYGFTPKSIPSTSRLVAAAEARAIAGRNDPCAPLPSYKPFPRTGKDDNKEIVEKPPEKEDKEKSGKGLGKMVPPPPPPGGFIPPPPPGDGLSVAELPAPPAKPSVSSKMKLVAIVGDRAILSFADRSFARENHYPKSITLGPGEQFESLSVVGVNRDSVTLEEDGERSVKTIESVR